MVLNAASQMLREADELKQKISKFKSGTSMLQERSLWVMQQQLQKVYQKVLILDLDYALDKKVEQDLWNVGFKHQIEALQAISKDRKNPVRSEGQAMLSWVLQAAAGFYLCLLHQICTTFKLDLPFRRRASLLGLVEGWSVGSGGGGSGAGGVGSVPPASARYICQHCLVHLGDLARYRQQLRVAHTFYRHALAVSAHSGQPYNQLALVAWRRARRLGALYWHVRSLLVRAPFPPAPANLARTLRAAATNDAKPLPVIPGVTDPVEPAPVAKPVRLDAHSYVTELIKAIYYIHTVEELDKASAIVNSLNSSLTALIATDSFESMTLIKMACVLIWLVHSSTEELSVDSNALSEGEARAARLSCKLAGGALLALLLPHYSVNAPVARAMPALKVWLAWVAWHPRVTREAGWATLAALWPALAHVLNMLAPAAEGLSHAYDSVPLPEDEELAGFLPLESAFKGLKFPNHASWDTYGGRVPDLDEAEDDDADPCVGAPPSLGSSPELEHRVRAQRLLQLGKRLADLRPDHLTCTEEDGKLTFTASAVGGEQLSRALAELAVWGGGPVGGAGSVGDPPEPEDESDEEPAPPPPVVISEADFREKVREIRVGILKPQGSLERAREERALATQEEQDADGSDESKSEERKEARRSRVNIAMAAIMRKQEETSKQVKFVTPPPTPDSTGDSTEAKDDKPKTIQPKAIKSLANIPIGRKTGGILSLKDKSAGYPHLVNTEDPVKKTEKDDKKEVKPNQGSSQNSQNYQLKRQDHVTSPSWPAQAAYTDGQRMNFQKNYGIQNAGLSYNPSYPAQSVNHQGIKLPVVNPKEIDVRTAALQKQNSRQDLFQDGPKFNPGYQMSGDKKNFLNDLPPRFANQYRYWQNAQESQFENKFRDDSFKPNSLFNAQPARTWSTPQSQQNPPEGFQQQMWWKPEQSNFNATYTQPIQANFYSPHNASLANPYSNPPYNLQSNLGQSKQESFTPSYLQSAIGQPQLQTLQNLVTSPNFNSSLNSFNSFAPTVSYDSAMYPQFSNKLGYQPVPMKMMDKPQLGYQGGKDLMEMGGLGFGSNAMDMQQRSLNFNEPLSDVGGAKSLDHLGTVSGVEPGNTYSLFSGAPDASAWGHAHTPSAAQSLWSGPGPSPLERLLDQQKQMKPPAP